MAEFDHGIARQYFGVRRPVDLVRIIRTEAPMTLRRAAAAVPDEEARFRIWLAAYVFDSIVDPRRLLTDPRYLARADALIEVRRHVQDKDDRAGLSAH